MFSHPNMSENTEIIENDTIDTNEAIGDVMRIMNYLKL